MSDLRIKKSDEQKHWNGELWTFENPYEEETFKHFSGGMVAVVDSRVPALVYVASLHGWTVTRVSEENAEDCPLAGSREP